MFWSDTVTSTIHQANLDGTNEQILVDSNIRVVGMLFEKCGNNLFHLNTANR